MLDLSTRKKIWSIFKYLILVYFDTYRLIVVLQENTYIYDINSLAILDTIDTVPNSKGNSATLLFTVCLNDDIFMPYYVVKVLFTGIIYYIFLFLSVFYWHCLAYSVYFVDHKKEKGQPLDHNLTNLWRIHAQGYPLKLDILFFYVRPPG